jgi:hypothetical protein
MAMNASEGYNQALSLFSSLYEDMAASDLPEGLSPDNQDIVYLPGSVGTRPAFNRTLSQPTPEPTSDTMSLTEFAMPSGEFLRIWLYSSGNLWQQPSTGGSPTQLGSITVGSRFCSVTAFDKQWFAFFNQNLSNAFSQSPFCGADVPRYFDGQNVWRVTQDAPGVPPTFTEVPTLPVGLAQTSPTGTLSVTTVVSSGAKVFTIQVPHHTLSEIIYTSLTYTCTGAVPLTWLNTQITVTGCTGTNSSLANTTGMVIAISGSTFTLGVGTGSIRVNLTSQSGTATLPGNYFTRSANIVTAYFGSTNLPNFQAGLYAKIFNLNNSQINGPNWTITAIARDTTGLVTVTISTQLTNLPSGTLLFISATDTTDFPPGYHQVFQVISATGGTTVFTISDPTWGNGAVATSSGGSVYQTWNGTFQILSVGVDANSNNFITYFQLGPDANLTSTGGTPQAQLEAQIPPGPRSAVLMFESVNGAITPASVPIQLSITGGPNLLSAQDILIGPPGTAKRIIAFTPAFGSSFFYVSPAVIPSVAGVSPVLSLGTIINDNTTTTAILDFSDSQLVAGTPIDVQGNDLFNQIVLAPCLGCIEYEGRMCWWGEVNNLKNLSNMGFDGGYNAPVGVCDTNGTAVAWDSGDLFSTFAAGASIVINNISYVVQSVADRQHLTLTTSAGVQTGVTFTLYSPTDQPPPGWTIPPGVFGFATLVASDSANLGFAIELFGIGGSTDGIIVQPAVQDFFGAPIVVPSSSYLVRLQAKRIGSSTVGSLVVDLFSPSTGLQITATFPRAGMPTGSLGWMVAPFNAAIPSTLPSDTLFRIYLNGVLNTNRVIVDELSIIDASKPVLFQQLRVSYFDNEFGYDQTTGVIGIDSAAKITALLKQRSYLFALTDGPMYQTQNNGQTEPNGWGISNFADECDCFGPNAVTATEDIAWWAGRSGWKVFSGATPKKISQEIQPTWESINQSNPTSIWALNDPEERITYLGVPRNGATKINFILPMSYRSVDAAYNVPDPIHTSYSGKMIATDLCRKWTRWNAPMNCAAMLTNPDLSRQIYFGGQDFGNFYSLNPAKYTDDDYGQIFSFYTTYFFFNHDIEQNAPGLGLHRKLDTYLSAYVTGVGQIQVTPLVNNLNNPWGPIPTAWDSVNQKWIPSGSPTGMPLVPLTLANLLNDLEWPLNVRGLRVAYKFAPVPLAGQTDAAFLLQHLVLTAKQDAVTPVRGSNL